MALFHLSVTQTKRSAGPVSYTHLDVYKRQAQHGEGVNKNKTFKDVYGWGSSTICNLLEKREYLGHTINFKTRKHFKDKKSHYVPEDEWTIFENTHEPVSYTHLDVYKRQGEYTVKQIMEAMLVPSGNDAAYVLAYHIAKNELGEGYTCLLYTSRCV